MQPLSVGPLRRDPAPSRVAYRLHRLWLTPFFRSILRVGLPSFVLAFGCGLFLSDEGRREALSDGIAGMVYTFQHRPEFMVNLLAVDGASDELAETARRVLALSLPMSSFDIDLEAERAKLETLDAVAHAELRVRPGGVLQVTIAERLPAVIWRMDTGLALLDDEGRRVQAIDTRLDRPDLPLIAGDGADAAVPEALDILAAAQPIIGRVRGLVRLGERRWDLVLDRDQRVLLPERGAVRALERVIALDQAQDLLARDILAIDMRDEHRPTLRLSPVALGELRRIKSIDVAGTDTQ